MLCQHRRMETGKEILDTLKGFYSVVKACEHLERFVFITGVSKFCHVSLFSDLNNLTDITMDARYATMFGYTQDELEANFGDRIAALAGDAEFDVYKGIESIKEYNESLPPKEYRNIYRPYIDWYTYYVVLVVFYNCDNIMAISMFFCITSKKFSSEKMMRIFLFA